jgi:hypothetical protein
MANVTARLNSDSAAFGKRAAIGVQRGDDRIEQSGYEPGARRGELQRHHPALIGRAVVAGFTGYPR